MLKKVLVLACVLLLLMGAGAGAEEIPLPLYTLVSLTGEGEMVMTGTAVLLGSSTTLVTTPNAFWSDTELTAVGGDESIPVERVQYVEDGQLAVLTLARPATLQPMTPGANDGQLTCVGVTAQGQVLSVPAQRVTAVDMGDTQGILYTGPDNALPGSVLLNSKGLMAGLCAASYGEGLSRYVAWPASDLNMVVSGTAAARVEWLQDLSVSDDKGIMTVDWSGIATPTDLEECEFTLFWQDAGNSYYNYASVVWEEGYATLPAVPGRTYGLWLQKAAKGEKDVSTLAHAEHMTTHAVAETEPYAQRNYKDVEAYLGYAPADQVLTTEDKPTPLETFTAKGLTDPAYHYHLQVTSTYEAEEEANANMFLALWAPDGSVYVSLNGYIFVPELKDCDPWNADVTQMLKDCYNFTALMRGEYSLTYYLDGQLATEVLFTIE